MSWEAFNNWFASKEELFHQGQMDVRQIAFAVYLEGQRQRNIELETQRLKEEGRE